MDEATLRLLEEGDEELHAGVAAVAFVIEEGVNALGELVVLVEEELFVGEFERAYILFAVATALQAYGVDRTHDSRHTLDDGVGGDILCDA